jgi:hypothetical protein
MKVDIELPPVGEKCDRLWLKQGNDMIELKLEEIPAFVAELMRKFWRLG